MKPYHFISIFIVLFASYVCLHYYLACWLVRHFALSPTWTRVVKYSLLALAAAFPAAAYISRTWHGPATEILYYLATIWLGVFFIWSAAAFASDIIQLLLSLSGLLSASGEGLPRARLTGHIVLSIVILLSVFAFYEGNRPARIKELHIELPNLPPSLDGFSIVLVADLHLHGRHSLNKLRKIIASLNKLAPDLIAFGGDIIDPGFRHTDELKELMNSISSRYEMVGIMGNHEFYFGRQRAAEFYRESGIRLLRNEVIKFKDGGLQVAGVDDIRTTGLTDRLVGNVLKKLDPLAPSIYLSHQPLKFQLASKHKVGLMLSGHTHKGQIFPFHFFVRLFYRNFYGLFREGDSLLYVTSGCGTWGPPMRLFASSELPYFILHPKAGN